MASLVITFAADHPAAAGHFPGNPIVPGALLLSEAVTAVGAALARDLSRCTVRSAKFPAPSRPGERIDIAYSASSSAVSLVCTVDTRTVLKAELACTVETEGACSANQPS